MYQLQPVYTEQTSSNQLMSAPSLQADCAGWARLQLQWDRSVALLHRPVCLHPHLRSRSQLPHPASPRGERARAVHTATAWVWADGAHTVGNRCEPVCLVSPSLSFRWGTGRAPLCCSCTPISWSLCPRRWATCRSWRSSTSATTSESSLGFAR